MKLTSLFTSTLALVTAAMAEIKPLAFDQLFDYGRHSLNNVACSNGENGLITRGYIQFASLPGWPDVGAVDAVSDWNDVDCGSCWSVTYTDAQGVSRSAFITAIDSVSNGYVVSKNTMDRLTGGHAEDFGIVNVQSSRVDDSNCGFT